jgi:tetratricopeptide (TPR) repeat protein
MALVAACWFAAAAQPAPPDASLSVQTAIAKTWQLERSGWAPGEFAAARDEARRLLATMPVEDGMFLSSVESLAQRYVEAGWRAKGIAIYQDALARFAALPPWHFGRVRLLLDLANEWEDDGNLLKALPFLEQAVAAQAAAPPNAPTGKDPRALNPQFTRLKFASCGGSAEPLVVPYIRLARLYRRLGRLDAAAAVVAKVAALGSHGGAELADYLQFGGSMDEVAALYRRLAQDSTNPPIAADCLEKAAGAFRAAHRYDDAVAASRDAISAVEKASDESAADRLLSLRQDLAMQLQGAGQIEESDRIYQSLLQSVEPGDKADQLAMSYARYLASTKRAPQAEAFLKDYWERSGGAVLNQLAAYAEQNGNTKAAAEYRQQAAALNPPRPKRDLAVDLPIAQLWQVNAELNDGPDGLFARALHEIETARPADLPRLARQIPGIAERFLASKQPERANQIFEKLLVRAQSDAEDEVNVLLDARRSYIRFLLHQPSRSGAVQAAVDQLHLDLIGANGPESAKLMEPIEFKYELARARSDVPRAEAAGQEMLAIEVSLTGRTSESYLNRLDMAASIYEKDEHYAQALPLRGEQVPLADALTTPNDPGRRVVARISFALALANVGKFSEAEAMAREAVELQKISHAPVGSLDAELKKIQDLQRATKGRGL